MFSLIYQSTYYVVVIFSRQEQFEKSAAGRAARAQQQGMAKQAANSNKGEPVLKVLVIEMLILTACLL
jgi:hypothetical protein